MTFIITLIVLLIERFFDWSHVRQWHWFLRYQGALSARMAKWPAFLIFILCVAPLLIIVGAAEWASSGWLFGLFKLVFGILIVMYCMGPANLWAEMYSCLTTLQSDDVHAAHDKIKAVFHISVVESSAQSMHQAFTRALFCEANSRIFAVIFWFLVLGPVGAVLYRLIALLSAVLDTRLAALSNKLLNLLNWLPVRVFAFIFALAGHFTRVFSCWKKSFKQGLRANDTVLAECGVAALDVVKENQFPEDGAAEKEALALIDRVLIIGLVILAVIVLL